MGNRQNKAMGSDPKHKEKGSDPKNKKDTRSAKITRYVIARSPSTSSGRRGNLIRAEQ